ncbi:MAG: hypothetical protein JW841_10665 [Deltaproteobacteria bacterium]|nr:hypothetical protein [Deltaproteobacteria bacterium]
MALNDISNVFSKQPYYAHNYRKEIVVTPVDTTNGYENWLNYNWDHIQICEENCKPLDYTILIGIIFNSSPTPPELTKLFQENIIKLFTKLFQLENYYSKNALKIVIDEYVQLKQLAINILKDKSLSAIEAPKCGVQFLIGMSTLKIQKNIT